MNSLLEDHLTSSSFGRLKQPLRNRCRLLVCGIYVSRRVAASLGYCPVECQNNPIVKLVGEDGIEPSPSDFQSVVHTKYTILPINGCEGWNCTSGVSNVAGLQPAAFATTLTPQ